MRMNWAVVTLDHTARLTGSDLCEGSGAFSEV